MDDEEKERLVTAIMAMGVSRNAALRGLHYTGNCNADLAAAWIFENQDRDLDRTLADSEDSEDERGMEAAMLDQAAIIELEPCKMVAVVNMELSMSVGKIAAQVAHAAVELHDMLLQPINSGLMAAWQRDGQKTVVTKAVNRDQLLSLSRKAQEIKLLSCIITDSGRTQVEAGACTVFGIIGNETVVDQVTGSLPLL